MEKAHSSWRSVLTPTLSCEREQHLNVEPPFALIERESNNHFFFDEIEYADDL